MTADKLWLGFGECCWNTMESLILFFLIFELGLLEIDQDLIRPKLDNVLQKYYFCTFGFELFYHFFALMISFLASHTPPEALSTLF